MTARRELRGALRLVAGAGIVLVAACSDAGAPGGVGPLASPAASPVAVQGGAALSSTQLLARIQSSITDVAYHGTRRVRMRYRILGVLQDLEYVERVVSDGRGGFGMELGEIASPAMTPDEEEFFRILQDNRQGFFYRYRDFRIRDLELFQQSYTLRQTGLPEVCGRACVELEIRHRERGGRWYRVAVDPLTGVVMRAEEHVGPGGEVVASIGFETFEEGPQPDGLDAVPLFASSIEREELDLSISVRPQVGFDVLRPTLVPDGYRLESADTMRGEDGRKWVRLVYGDGVEQVFFLHSPVPVRHMLDSGDATPAAHEPTPQGSAPADGDDRVTVAAVGPWSVIEGSVRGQSIIALGKVVEAELLQMVQSALESGSR